MGVRIAGITLLLGVVALALWVYLGVQSGSGPGAVPHPAVSPGQGAALETRGEDPIAGGREGLLGRAESLGAEEVGAASDESAGGRSSAGLSGIVVDEAGRAVREAAVWIGRASTSAGPAEGRRGTTTDVEGRFELADLGMGWPLVLAVDHPEHQPLELEGVQPTAAGASLTVELRSGCVVRGVLADTAGAPVEGARVHFEVSLDSALRFGDSILLMQTGGGFGIRRVATTDRDGRFRLGGLWPVAGVVAARTPAGHEALSEEIHLDPEKPREVVLQLGYGWSLEGTVRGIGGPIESATVTLRGEHASSKQRLAYMELARPTWRTTADGSGRFEIAGLRSGAYELEVTAAGHAPHLTELELETNAHLDVLLDRAGSLSGALHGVPAGESATLWLLSDAGRRSHTREVPSTGSPTTFRFLDVPAGSYRVAGRSATCSEASSSPCEVFSGLETEGVRLHLPESSGVRGTVRAARTRAPVPGAAVTLVPPSRPHSETDGLLSLPIFFIRQVDSSSPPKDALLTDELGRFELAGVRTGRHSLRVTHAGHAMRISDPFEIERPGEWHELDLELLEGGIVAGRVETRHGEPVAQEAAVLRALPAGEPFWRARSGEKGELEFPRLPAGNYEAVLEPRRNSRAAMGGQDPFLVFPTERIMLEEGGRADFVLVRDPTTELSGKVVDAGGEPVDAYVIFRSVRAAGVGFQGISTTRWCRTDTGGDYRLDELEPGLYLIDALASSGSVPLRRQVELLSGVPGSMDFRLPGGEVRGQVVDAGGTPLSGATVRLQPEPADPTAFPAIRYAYDWEVFDPELPALAGAADPLGIRARSTSADGRFRFPWVPDGQYRLRVQHPGLPVNTDQLVPVSSEAPPANLTVTLGAESP